MRKLIINGVVADLPDDTVIALTKQSNNIFDFQNKRSNLSNTIKLPLSDTNKGIFEDADDIAAYSTDIRNFHDVKYIQEYEEIISQGQGKLLNSVDSFEFTTYWGNIDLVAILGDKTLRDLDLDDLTHVWNMDNVTALNVGSDDLIYPVLNTHETEELREGTASIPLYAARVMPMVSLSRILEQIQSDNDIEYTGNIVEDYLSPTVDEDSYIPTITKKYEIDVEDVEQSLSTFTILSNTVSAPFAFGDHQYTGGFITNELTVLEDGTYEYASSFNQSFGITGLGVAPTTDIPLTVDTIIAVDVYNTVLGAWNNPTYLEVLAGGYAYGTSTDAIGLVGGIASVEFISASIPRGYYRQGDRIRLNILSDITLDNNAESFTSLTTENIVLPPSTMTFIPQPLIEFNDTWAIEKTLPEIKQIDLLKYIAAKKCYLMDIEDGTRKIRFKKFSDLSNNVGDALDISEITESTKITSYHSELSQENDLIYDNFEGLGNIGKGILTVADNTLTPLNEFYKAPFSASKNELWNNITIGRFPTIKIWNEDLEDVGSRIYRLKKEEFTALYFTAGLDTDSTTEKYIAYWSDVDNFQSIIDSEYVEYKAMMDNFTAVQSSCLLSDEIFKSIDLLEPVFIQQEGSYFMIQIIKDYVSGKPVGIDLIKL